MLKKSTFMNFGLLDEIFNPGYGEDIDYCIRLHNLGYGVVQVPNDIQASGSYKYELQFPIWHKSSVTVREVPGWESIVARNEKILKSRIK
jgi:GT2 family glycosyltransferase